MAEGQQGLQHARLKGRGPLDDGAGNLEYLGHGALLVQALHLLQPRDGQHAVKDSILELDPSLADVGPGT